LDIGVLGYIGIVQHKEHSPEVLSIPPGTPCIATFWEIKKKTKVIRMVIFSISSFCLDSHITTLGRSK